MKSVTGRRTTLGAMVSLLVFLMVVTVPALAVAQDRIEPSQLGELPTAGGFRPGPIGIDPPVVKKLGVTPTAIKIDKVQIDSQVEQRDIINGVMQDPSGPFIVSWYKDTGRLGEDNNIVMAGHLDYWDVGQAVFYNVWKLQKNDEIDVTGEDGVVVKFKVDWVKNYKIADLDAKGLQQIVGDTKTEKLTLITCGGQFDYNKGEYLERIVIRASPIN
jgi:Sortase domain